MQKLKVVVFSLDASMKPLSQNKKINDWFRLCSDSVFCFIELKSDIDALDQSFLLYVCMLDPEQSEVYWWGLPRSTQPCPEK